MTGLILKILKELDEVIPFVYTAVKGKCVYRCVKMRQPAIAKGSF
jgi:hypothetical protein